VPKRALVVVAAVGVAAASMIGIGSAAGGSPDRPALRAWGFGAGRPASDVVPHINRARTLSARATGFVITSIDNDPAGTSQGDQIVVEGTLTHRHGHALGGLEVTEVFTGLPAGGGARLELTLTVTLPAGQISAVGVGRVTRAGVVKIRLPVVGGTGKYRNARGVVLITSSQNAARLTFLLVP
jgi:hypothetical protein